MSRWTWPTTADLGIRAMSSTLEGLFVESALGVLEAMQPDLPESLHVKSGEWEISLHRVDGDVSNAVLLLAWLDEILFRAQHAGEWLLDAAVQIADDVDKRRVRASVHWTDGASIDRGVEVKAISSHGLCVEFVQPDAVLPGILDHVPELVGPAWYADTILDV